MTCKDCVHRSVCKFYDDNTGLRKEDEDHGSEKESEKS